MSLINDTVSLPKLAYLQVCVLACQSLNKGQLFGNACKHSFIVMTSARVESLKVCCWYLIQLNILQCEGAPLPKALSAPIQIASLLRNPEVTPVFSNQTVISHSFTIFNPNKCLNQQQKAEVSLRENMKYAGDLQGFVHYSTKVSSTVIALGMLWSSKQSRSLFPHSLF